MLEPPWLHPPEEAWLVGRLEGYVVEDDGWYWTGDLGQDAWSRNPRRALVDYAPWDMHGSLPVKRGRCVRVILENEVTMLPLHLWPKAQPLGAPMQSRAT